MSRAVGHQLWVKPSVELQDHSKLCPGQQEGRAGSGAVIEAAPAEPGSGSRVPAGLLFSNFGWQ